MLNGFMGEVLISGTCMCAWILHLNTDRIGSCGKPVSDYMAMFCSGPYSFQKLFCHHT